MPIVKVHSNQSLVNLAVQHYGDARGILQLFEDGQFSGFDDIPVAGSSISISTPLKRAVTEYYEREIEAGRMIAVATASEENSITPTGKAHSNGFDNGFS